MRCLPSFLGLLAALAFFSTSLLNASVESKLAAPTVVFLGDSITAGLGVSVEEAYPSVVAQELEKKGVAIRSVNAGVSGDTSAGGLRRIDWLLRQKPQFVVVALGANDMLRGLPPAETERNLDQTLERIRKAGSSAVLLGMRAVSNYGADYQKRFDAIFPKLAKKHQVPFLPFFIQDTALKAELNQTDALHPTADGQRRIAARVSQFLIPIIRKAAPTPRSS